MLSPDAGIVASGFHLKLAGRASAKRSIAAQANCIIADRIGTQEAFMTRETGPR